MISKATVDAPPRNHMKNSRSFLRILNLPLVLPEEARNLTQLGWASYSGFTSYMLPLPAGRYLYCWPRSQFGFGAFGILARIGRPSTGSMSRSLLSGFHFATGDGHLVGNRTPSRPLWLSHHTTALFLRTMYGLHQS